MKKNSQKKQFPGEATSKRSIGPVLFSQRDALRVMDQPVVVVRRGGAGAPGRHRLSCAGPLLLSLAAAACALLLLGASAPPTADGPRRMELLRTELMLRSANLVIKDLADEWDEVNFNKEPFDFCGKAHMTTRQVRVCADYFLGSLRDTKGDNTKATSVLSGIPKLEPFDKCMLGATEHAVRACIREVTRALTPAEMVHLSRAGTTGDDKELDAVGVHALETAKPDASLEGLNGGMDGKVRGGSCPASPRAPPVLRFATLNLTPGLMRARSLPKCRRKNSWICCQRTGTLPRRLNRLFPMRMAGFRTPTVRTWGWAVAIHQQERAASSPRS